MDVLVTGCGGFLGSEIVRQLLARGDRVIGVSRRDYPELERLGMRHRRGDLTDASFVAESVRGADAVIHTAAVAGVWGPWRDFYEINTRATEQVIDACRSAGVRVLVFTSSPSVTFSGEDQRGVDESAPYPRRWLCAYPHTKALAEQAVLAAHDPGTLHTCALRPHLIWGEGDPHILPRLLERARRGRLKIVGSGRNRVDTVHVVNAAAAHLDAVDTLHRELDACSWPHPAAETAAGGRAYFIAQDEPVDCWQWIARICKLGGVPEPSGRIGYRTAYAVGAGLELAYRLAGRASEPPMTRFVAAQLARDHYFDISAARERLGYRVRVSTDQGLERLSKAWSRGSVDGGTAG